MSSTDIEKVLIERGNRYGEFNEHAQIAQDLKTIMHDTQSWDKLLPDMKEALDMIQHKIARILNGDPHYQDSWVDIAGYSKLVADGLKKAENPKQRKLLLDEEAVRNAVYVEDQDGSY